jgi:hypothetical protein
MVALDQAPDYAEGHLFPEQSSQISVLYAKFPYPGPGGGYYPISNILMVQEIIQNATTFVPNPPTSWFWNVRIGDKIQLNNSGAWYTVVGPMNVTPSQGNSEMFVNIGPPGTQAPKSINFNPNATSPFLYPEFLFLVNGLDDNGNGQTDEGWDGIDNDGKNGVDDLGEWEFELWTGAVANHSVSPVSSLNDIPYTIRRRPVPAQTSRVVALPSNVVVDLTTGITNLQASGYAVSTPSLERSRLPVNPYTGYVDVMINADGSILPSTIYSSPAAFGMNSAFFHFWLAERSDILPPNTSAKTAPYLPIPLPTSISGSSVSYSPLKGEYRLLTLFTRTGILTTNDNVPFDNPAQPANGTSYNVNMPFIQAQQGIVGGL